MFRQHYWDSQIFKIRYNTTRPLLKILKKYHCDAFESWRKVLMNSLRSIQGDFYWTKVSMLANFDATEAGQQGDGSLVVYEQYTALSLVGKPNRPQVLFTSFSPMPEEILSSVVLSLSCFKQMLLSQLWKRCKINFSNFVLSCYLSSELHWALNFCLLAFTNSLKHWIVWVLK